MLTKRVFELVVKTIRKQPHISSPSYFSHLYRKSDWTARCLYRAVAIEHRVPSI